MEQPKIETTENKVTDVITPEMLMNYFDTSPLDDDPLTESTFTEMVALAQDMSAHGLTAKDLLNIPRADFSFWETAVKKKRIEVGEDGKSHTVNDIEVMPQRGRKIQLRPKKDGVIDTSEWITTPPPLKMYGTKPSPKKNRADRLAVSFADEQIGFREHRDGTLTPSHDPRAMDVALQITKDLQPDLFVSGGDESDMSRLGKYKLDSVHYQGPQNLRLEILATHAFLGQIRRDNQNAEMKMLSSNHLQRWIDFFNNFAPEVTEIRPADDPNGMPLVSLERALALKALDIEFVAGYKAAVYHINDRLVTIHGDKSVNNGSTAHEYLKDFLDESVLFNHTHRIERAMKSHKGRVIQAMSSGCLSSVVGAVPSFHNAVDTMGEVVQQQENWQNGMSVIHYTEGNGPFEVEQILIDHNNGYRAEYGGKTYYPRPQFQRTWEQFEPGLEIREFPGPIKEVA